MTRQESGRTLSVVNDEEVAKIGEQAALERRRHAESIMALARSPPSSKRPSLSVINNETDISCADAINKDETGSSPADDDTVPTGGFHGYLLPRSPPRLTSPPPSDAASPVPWSFWTIRDLTGKQWQAVCRANLFPTYQQIAAIMHVTDDAFKAVVNSRTIIVVFNLRGGARQKGGTSVGSGRKKEPLWPGTRLPNGNMLYVDPKDPACQYEDSENLQGDELHAQLLARRTVYRRSITRQKLKLSSAAAGEPRDEMMDDGTNETGAPTHQAATPATTAKKRRGRPPTGHKWNGSQYVFDAETAARHAVRDAENKVKREKEGLRGPGRPKLAPREPEAETKGTAAPVEVKKREEAVLSSFMKAHEALAEQQPEQSARAALRLEEPGDESAQQVHPACHTA